MVIVQKLRLQRGWSQEQLAELAGLSVRTIQRIERGVSGSPESLKALAAVFEVDFSTLQPEKSMEQPELAPSMRVSPEEALAFARVRKIRGFYIHLAQYVVVVTGLVVFNMMTSPHKPWSLAVALGWATGILAHGLAVFGKVPFLGAEWERRQVEALLGRKL